MLEKCANPGLAHFLILGADVIPEVDGHDGSFVVLMDDQGESVREHDFLVRDIDVLGLRGPRETSKSNSTNNRMRILPPKRLGCS